MDSVPILCISGDLPIVTALKFDVNVDIDAKRERTVTFFVKQDRPFCCYTYGPLSYS